MESIMKYVKLENGLVVPDWSTVDLSNAVEQLNALYNAAKRQLIEASAMETPTFDALSLRAEDISEKISRITGPISHLYGTRRNDFPGIKEISDKCDELASDFHAFVISHKPLYDAHVKFRNSPLFAELAADQQYQITESIASWERQGVVLASEVQGRIAEIRKELTQLSSDFTDAVVNSTDSWHKHIAKSDELRGLLPVHLEMFSVHAKGKGFAEGYVISLQPSHYMTVMDYAEDATLRKEVFEAYATRASDLAKDPSWDNSTRALRMLLLRKELAGLLGYDSYSEYSIQTKMVKAIGVSGVEAFQKKIADAAMAKSVSENAALEVFAHDTLGMRHLELWDRARVARLYREHAYQLDDEEVRKYFPIGKVWAGFAERLNELFGVSFVRTEAPLPHADAEFYEVRDEDGRVIAGFYADLYSREGKQGGAWMDSCILRRELTDGTVQLPVGYLCANFRPPVPGKEAYLSHDEVNTLFHEGGHEFHLMLAKTRSRETSMNSVEWDAIELPSQYMEEWCYDPETLAAMSAHEDTGDAIPSELIAKIRDLRHFNAGLMYSRQSVFGIFDWRAHKQVPTSREELLLLYREVKSEFDVRETSPVDRMPLSFTHIFGGGYSSGYFSYLWAEGLVADVVSAFEETRIEYGESAERAMMHRYRDEILAVGAERPFADSFRKFRGRDLDPDMLIKHLGLE